MYQDEYKRWAAADLLDFDLNKELNDIAGDDEAIKDRFAVALEFGTAGLRGVLGAGTNRMNIWVVRQATQGVADWVKTQGGTQTVAISYDSRLKGWNFAREAAGVLAANGIHVRLYEELMPVPALSFATRYYHCNAGIMITASHNPAQYNGYKAYGPDGCQMTDDAAAVVYASIQKTDVLTGAKHMSFAEGVEKGLIQFVGEDCKDAFYAAIEDRQVRPGLAKTPASSSSTRRSTARASCRSRACSRTSASRISRSCRSRSTRMATSRPAAIRTRKSSRHSRKASSSPRRNRLTSCSRRTRMLTASASR